MRNQIIESWNKYCDLEWFEKIISAPFILLVLIFMLIFSPIAIVIYGMILAGNVLFDDDDYDEIDGL